MVVAVAGFVFCKKYFGPFQVKLTQLLRTLVSTGESNLKRIVSGTAIATEGTDASNHSHAVLVQQIVEHTL